MVPNRIVGIVVVVHTNATKVSVAHFASVASKDDRFRSRSSYIIIVVFAPYHVQTGYQRRRSSKTIDVVVVLGVLEFAKGGNLVLRENHVLFLPLRFDKAVVFRNGNGRAPNALVKDGTAEVIGSARLWVGVQPEGTPVPHVCLREDAIHNHAAITTRER